MYSERGGETRNSRGAAAARLGPATAMGMMRVTMALQIFQAIHQEFHGLAPVGKVVLGGGVQLGGGLVLRGNEEEGIVAETAFAAGSGKDLAVPLALGDDGLGIVGATHQHQDADEMGLAVSLAGQGHQEFF